MSRTPRHDPPHTLYQTLILGWKVLASELCWGAIRTMRNTEIRQLRRRLRQEYHYLGRLHSAFAPPVQDLAAEQKLCQRQITFFEQEIGFLEHEIAQSRRAYVQARLQKWEMGEDTSPA
ncbi:MAG: hypothetical protein ACQESV_06220 [Thermodesulfobacteriota bacterium]